MNKTMTIIEIPLKEIPSPSLHISFTKEQAEKLATRYGITERFAFTGGYIEALLKSEAGQMIPCKLIVDWEQPQTPEQAVDLIEALCQ